MSDYFKKTILLIDDDATFVEVVEFGLSHAGYTVLTATNGQEGVQLFESTLGIDIVILDMLMPVMDGYDTYFKLKRIDPDLKIIVITGYYGDERVNEILSDGRICEFLKKPFGIKELISKVELIISMR